jgi:hypothetical protein
VSGSQFQTVFELAPQIAGSILGSPYQQFRPSSATNPLASGNLLSTLSAWITADEKGRGTKAATYAKPVWFGMFDPTITQVGDYLVGPLGTFFIASQNVPQPMQVVLCNHAVTISQPATEGSFGASTEYGGDIVGTETILATAWPCSMLQGTKGEQGTSRLPGDVKQPWSIILLPPIPGVNLRNDLIATDETGQRHVLSSTELSALGWRITVALVTT